MLDFVKFLIKESISKEFGQLKHLEHLEDHVINDGEAGFHHAKKVLDNVRNRIKGGHSSGTLTTKYDGSPSVVFGHHPKTKHFFVASKSAFNKTPKLNYTPEDIERNHGHAPGLVSKLKAALEHLPKVAPKKGVYQGDLMYGEGDVHEHKDMLHFTPNTIMYSAKKKSNQGERIAKSKLGVVVHTKYHGHDIGDMKASFEPDVHNFSKHSDVNVIDHQTQLDPKSWSDVHEKMYNKHFKAAEKHFKLSHPETFSELAQHTAHIKTYINKTVRTGEKPTPGGYRTHLLEVAEREAGKVKTPEAKERKYGAIHALVKHAEEHHDKLASLFNIHHHLQHAKNQLVDALSRGGEFEHSIGGRTTKPEGFVATIDGQPTKLVDRGDFSRANFAKARE